MLSNTRLTLLPLHRLASGLRRIYSLSKPAKNTFIHYDSQVHEEDQPDIVKCVSNILDGTPARWKEDEALQTHLEKIVSSYQASSPKNSGRADSLITWGVQEQSPSVDSSVASSQEQHDEAFFGPGEWSLGSAGHAQGMCKPCGWNRKPGGCSKGADCEFCHTCNDSALKKKKKDRLQRIKESKRAARKLEEAFHEYQFGSQATIERRDTW